jgi:hypothetical protein
MRHIKSQIEKILNKNRAPNVKNFNQLGNVLLLLALGWKMILDPKYLNPRANLKRSYQKYMKRRLEVD